MAAAAIKMVPLYLLLGYHVEDMFEVSDTAKYDNRKVYLELGRQLQAPDIGKKVVRVYPMMEDWSCMFSPDEPDRADELVAIENNVVKVADNFGIPIVLSMPNDWFWCTLDEMSAYLKQNPNGGLAFKDAHKAPPLHRTTQIVLDYAVEEKPTSWMQLDRIQTVIKGVIHAPKAALQQDTSRLA